MLKKRIISYGIDLIIVTMISSFLLAMFSMDNSEEFVNSYNHYINITNSYLENEVSENEVIQAEYDMMQTSSTLYITKIAVTLIYFSILPYLRNGQTIGKRITKIKVESNNNQELNPGLMFLRGTISSLIYIDIINMIALSVASPNAWYNITYLTSSLTYVTYIVLLQFIIIRKDKRSLHDLISNTKVIEIK